MSDHSTISLLTNRSSLDEHLCAILTTEPAPSTALVDRYCRILDEFLQLPTLLDPILPTHISSLCDLILQRLQNLLPHSNSQNSILETSFAAPCRALYTLIKVRGVKNVHSHLPHQVHHLRSLLPALIYVERSALSTELWHLRYVLYVWLAVAVRIPFPLHSVVTPATLDDAIHHSRAALSNSGPIAQAAASFLARLLARPNTHQYRVALVNWAITHTLHPSADTIVHVSGLSFLAVTFKHAPRQLMLPFVQPILTAVQTIVPHHLPASTTEAHLIAKLSQRLALSFLPIQPLAWRYVQQTKTLFSRAGHSGLLQPSSPSPLSDSNLASLELIIDLLLNAVCHRDTIVRYSAAKGVARIAARLPHQLAHDIITSVVQLFDNISESRADASSHGACLALAELARRGLLLPNNPNFALTFQAIRKAAQFDMRRGASSVGAYVRDAACYAVWAIARAYEREHVAPYAVTISKSMLPVALLDREVNCRRAAAAALQECVGRLTEQLFPDGIQLITMADYFSLGDRNAAYLNIALRVVSLADGIYFQCILDELCKHKLLHWDPAIRALSAKSIALLVAKDKDETIVKNVIPHLVKLATQRGDMVHRHGAILGLAELARVVGRDGFATLAIEILRLPAQLEENRLFTGRTGDDTRVACCQLIEGLAVGVGSIYLDNNDARKDAQESLKFLEKILGCGKEHLYASSASAYSALCNHVIAKDEEWHLIVTKRIIDGLSNSTFCEYQRGFALAAGVCGDSPIVNDVATVLCKELLHNVDVEVRRNAAISLNRLPLHVLCDRITDVLKALQKGMRDFAKDDRGDIGSWVREASMKSVCQIVANVFGNSSPHANATIGEEEEKELMTVIQYVAEQCCSRIDRTRSVAGASMKGLCKVLVNRKDQRLSGLCSAISSNLSFSFEESIIKGEAAEVSFKEAKAIFPVMKNILNIPEVFEPVLHGFVSTGGTPGQQSRAARDALGNFIVKAQDSGLQKKVVTKICDAIDRKDERLLIPALRLLDGLLQIDVFEALDPSLLLQMIKSVKKCWRQKLGDVPRVIAAIGVLSELGSLSVSHDSTSFEKGSLGRECLEGLAIILGGPIPRLRRIAADAVYLILLEIDFHTQYLLKQGRVCGVCEHIQEASEVSSDTEWEELDVIGARLKRNELCHFLDIRAPIVAPKQKLISTRKGNVPR